MAVIQQLLGAINSGSTGTIWDAASKNASIVLSPSGRIATNEGSTVNRNVRSVDSVSTGKYYVEFQNITYSTNYSIWLGIVNGSFDMATDFVGGDFDSVATLFAPADGGIYTNAGLLLSISDPLASGGDIDMSLDVDAETIGFRYNGGSWFDYSIASANSGPWYLAATLYDGSNGSNLQLATKTSELRRTPRSGYGSWPGVGATSTLLEGGEADGTTIIPGNDFSIWSTDRATKTVNAANSPDNTDTAATLVENSDTGRHIIYYNLGSVGGDHEFLFYIKENGRRYAMAQFGATNSASIMVDLQTGTVTDQTVSGSATIASYSVTPAANSFYKVAFRATVSASPTTTYAIIALSDRDTIAGANEYGNPSYAGDGTSGVYLWRPKVVT